MERIFELAELLTDIPAVSGREDTGTDRLVEICGKYFDEYTVTPLNSFIGHIKCGDGGAPTVLLDAHFDQVGFIVTRLCGGGFLKTVPVGKLDPRVLSASEVFIYGKKTIEGVFTSVPPHLSDPGDENKPMKTEELYIDTGLGDEELSELVDIGTTAAFRSSVCRLRNGFVAGKCFDDRICVAAILRALELRRRGDLKINLAVEFSSCEETGYKGAITSVNRIKPDYAVVLDVTHAYVPEAQLWRKGVQAGSGAVVSYSAQTSRSLTERAVKTAEAKKIPVQLYAEPNRTGTNSNAVQTAAGGVPTVLVSIPLKNMHTANEIVKLEDVYNASLLINSLLDGITEDAV